MDMEKRLDSILDTKSKLKIIRLFVSKRHDFMASGREIAKRIGLTPPATHTALKELHEKGVLERQIAGKQHIYKLNQLNRTVKDILQPAFRKERSVKEDMHEFLLTRIRRFNLTKTVVSLILYGSMARGATHAESDCDIAVVVKNSGQKARTENLFLENISGEFSAYFGIHLDVYVKTEKEFSKLLKRCLPPVSTLMKAYFMIYGKDPIDYK